MLLLDPNHSASNLFTTYLIVYIYLPCIATFLMYAYYRNPHLLDKLVFSYFARLNNIIYSNRRFKMSFSTIVLIVLVAAVAYTLAKAFSKKESVVEAIKEEVAEVKAVEAKVEEKAKVVATKAKATASKAKTAVKKATTKPKAK